MSQQPINRSEGPSGPSQPRQQGRRILGQARPIPRYQLILPAAAVTDMMQVIRAIMDVTRLGRAEATHKMWQAHYGERSRILVTHLERAELYVEQFAAKGVAVMLEPI